MSTSHLHVQNTSVRDINVERYIRVRGNRFLPNLSKTQTNARNAAHYPEENMREINDQISKHFKSTEQPFLWKYLMERKSSPLRITEGAKKYLRVLEGMDSNTLKHGLKKTKSKLNTERKKSTEILRKNSDRALPSHVEAWEMKQKEKSLSRDKSSINQQGDIVKKDSKINQTARYLHNPMRSDRSLPNIGAQKEKGDPDYYLNTRPPVRTTQRITRASATLTESAKRRYNLYSEMRSRNNIALPRLVHSDLSERRMKANIGKPSKEDSGRGLDLEQALALLEGELNQRQAEMEYETRNSLSSPRLRESVSDAKVSRSGSQGGKRPRGRKPLTPPKSRGSRVRNPRSLANFLRTGFHPPEPGTGARRCVDWGPLPGVKPLVESMLSKCQAMSGGPGGDLSSLPAGTRKPQTPPSPSGSDRSRKGPLGDRAARSVLVRPTVVLPRNGAELLGDQRPATVRTGKRAGGRPDTSEKPPDLQNSSTSTPELIPEVMDGTCPLDAYFPSEANIAINATQTFRNRRGRPAKGPPSYRSIPVLRGNLFLTMPSISEENEEWEHGSGDRASSKGAVSEEERAVTPQLMDKDEDDADEKKAEWLRRSEEERERYEQWNRKRLEEEDRRKCLEEERKRRQEEDEWKKREERDQRRLEDQEKRRQVEEEETRKLEENIKELGNYKDIEKLIKKHEDKIRSSEEKDRKAKEEVDRRRMEKLEVEEKKTLEKVTRKVDGEGGKAKVDGKVDVKVEGKERRDKVAAAVLSAGRRSPAKVLKRERERQRRAAIREAAAEAERKAAEKVLGRWAQKHVASMQRRTVNGLYGPAAYNAAAHTPNATNGRHHVHHHHHHHHHHRGHKGGSVGGGGDGNAAETSPRKSKKGRGDKADKPDKGDKGDKKDSGAGKEHLDKALHELWKSAKIAAVRQGEKELLARAANIMETKLSR